MSTILVDNLTGKTSAGSITVTSEGGAATQSLQQGLAKAWGAFQQAGTQTFYDSFNMASITDLGTGLSQLTMSSIMSNANYASVGCSGEQSGGGNRVMGVRGSAGLTTSSIVFANYALSTGSISDDTRLSASLSGDLA